MPRVIAAFDLDGTITHRDTLPRWLLELHGWTGLVSRGLPALPAMARTRHRSDAKAALFARLLAGVPFDDAAGAAHRVALRLRRARKGVRRDVVNRLREHQAKGHEVVVVSASPELVARAVVEHLDIPAENVIATRLEVDADGVLTGRIVGRNNRDDEKVARLREWEAATGGDVVERIAYGDSSGDDALFAFADQAFRVGRR